MILSACVHCNTIAHNCRMKIYYDVLGIPTNAMQEQGVIAYRLRGKLLHPDRFGR
jgi:curved DNA-binding protein CbpA